ncbi:glycosyltransferase family 29 protein [Aureimonas sp. AU40]|uniref:glycosyltransferase family 29 protein n=1 Tax=Aureimonas sp. AU40 TaxID=1637747 RepID=UPI00078217B8|nr:glycosyltransferase family 29 protein [Aureimonas sp. AU40]
MRERASLLPHKRSAATLAQRQLRDWVSPLGHGAPKPAPRHGPHRPAPASPRSIAVVGNAPEAGRIGPLVDRADWVLRFNNAQGFGAATGQRVTHLFLMNFGGQTREWLAEESFHRRPAVARAQGFVLPIDPGRDERRQPTPTRAKWQGGEQDWTPELAQRLGLHRRPAWLLNDPLFHAAGDALRRHGAAREAVPSTGFLALFWLTRHLGGRRVPVHVHGFGFAGWEGHGWDAERCWAEGQARRGLLRLHPLPPN